MSRKEKVEVITKQYILDQLTDNEVDLSMNELSTIPVKELALVMRGTRLDVSRNHLKSLPDNFGSLRHLIGLDLSGNKLHCLPSSFGQLALLQRLDLYSNNLTSLPLSFSNLKKLKWLDMKNNPLEDGLREAAGTCVSSKECYQCATKVLAYMRLQQSQADRSKQNALESLRLQDRIMKEEEALRRGVIKKEKELRKRYREERLRQEREEDDEEDNEDDRDEEEEEEQHLRARHNHLAVVERRCCLSVGSVCTTLLLLSITAIVLVVIGIMMCSELLEPAQCQVIKVGLIKYVANILELLGAKVY